MSLQVVVIAHGNGVAAFRRHEKFWLALDAPLLVVVPENDPVQTKHELLKVAGAERNGHESIRRLNAMFEHLKQRNWDSCVIYEYDSFSLEPKLPCKPGLYGIVFHNAESPKFMAPRYANPPWFFDRGTFELLFAKARQYYGLHEEGEADRWISALAFLAGVPLFDYSPRGFSRGTIGQGDIPALEHAIKTQRAMHFHGVKQDWMLHAIEQFYDEANPSA